jgi:hypothetical protein
MLRRLAAVLLTFILSSQLLAAGICTCFDYKKDNHAKMSCCKSKKSTQTSISSTMSCCQHAGKDLGSKIPSTANISTVQISAPILMAVEKLITSLLKPIFRSTILIPKRAGDIPQLSIKPPALYLHNHAFLI